MRFAPTFHMSQHAHCLEIQMGYCYSIYSMGLISIIVRTSRNSMAGVGCSVQMQSNWRVSPSHNKASFRGEINASALSDSMASPCQSCPFHWLNRHLKMFLKS
jgi:hypothetical protein